MSSFESYTLISNSYGITDEKETRVSKRLINSPLDFIRFHEKGRERANNGAILIITGKQYIFAKNDYDGKQAHLFSFAKAYLEMEDKYSNVSFKEACKITSNREKNYLNFSIEVEMGLTLPIYRAMRTIIDRKISMQEFESFKAFFDKYSEIFRKIPFNYLVYDRRTNDSLTFKSIDEILIFLYSIVDENIKPYEYEKGEKIIGVPTNTDSFDYSIKKYTLI